MLPFEIKELISSFVEREILHLLRNCYDDHNQVKKEHYCIDVSLIIAK